MAGVIYIDSHTHFKSLLSSTNVVVVDFYADWCGSCKVIAPQFEALAKKNSHPGRLAFVKVNVDKHSTISGEYGVRSMPTFMVLRGKERIKVIRGADNRALEDAVNNAAKLAASGSAGGGGGGAFKTPGRRLGGDVDEGPKSASGLGMLARLDPLRMIRAAITFLGLYIWSLFSIDPYKAAEASPFAVNNRMSGGWTKHSATTRQAQPPGKKNPPSNFRTLADLRKED